MSWEGKLIRSVDTESSNTSGIAYGGGFLWMGANGRGMQRAPRPTDAASGEIVKCDPKTGKTVGRYKVPAGGGLHGMEFTQGTLWITSLGSSKLTQLDPKDMHILHEVPVHLPRAHGLAWDPPGMWCIHTSHLVIHKLDVKDGRVLEQIRLTPADPDPHGLCMYNGHLYYCDAGIGEGRSAESPFAGYICRVDFV
jgi:sugar lactone lactonase YvrE